MSLFQPPTLTSRRSRGEEPGVPERRPRSRITRTVLLRINGHHVKAGNLVLERACTDRRERPMARTTGKNPWGLRPVYRVGLGFMVVGVVVLIGLELAH